MKLSKLGLAVALTLLVTIWTIPLLAGDHSIKVQWQGPTNEVLNSDCNQQGAVLTNPVSYTVQYRKVGTEIWAFIETETSSIDIGSLAASTQYEVRVGAHYAGDTVLCWTDPVVIATLADQPPQPCTNLSVSSIK